MDTSQFQSVDIDKLVPYARNARTHSKAQITQLRSSLREFGFVSPAVIDEKYNILVGHGRVAAAREEGYTSVPCVFARDLSDTQKRAYILADNQLALNAGWDEDMLGIELAELEGEAFDLDLLGFDNLEALMGAGDTQDDEFDVDAELSKPTFTCAGDLWYLGTHRLICADSTKSETLSALMDGKQANLVVTDPPYNVDYQGSAGKIKNDSMEERVFEKFLFDAYSQMHEVMADDASIYVFHSDSHGLAFRKAFEDAGFYLSGCCIWKKQSLVLGRSPYQWQHEPVLYGWKKSGKHNWYSDRAQTTIWEFDKPRKNGEHPTMKPVPLLSYPIKNSSMKNCIVLDPFGGSGSTLIACEQLDRICYTAELDEKYCDVIVRRYIEYAGNTDNVAVLRDGKTLAFEDVVDSMDSQ